MPQDQVLPVLVLGLRLSSSDQKWCRLPQPIGKRYQRKAGEVSLAKVSSRRSPRFVLRASLLPKSRQCRCNNKGTNHGRKWGRGWLQAVCELQRPTKDEIRNNNIISPSTMNPQLANFILKKTPDFILHPMTMSDTEFTLNTGAKIPALGM